MVEFKIPLYKGTVKVFTEKDQFEEACEEIDGECEDLSGHSGLVQQFILDDSTILYLLGVFDGRLDTLIHECAHVAIFVAEQTGWDISDKTSEPFCYLLEEIFRLSHPALGD